MTGRNVTWPVAGARRRRSAGRRAVAGSIIGVTIGLAAPSTVFAAILAEDALPVAKPGLSDAPFVEWHASSQKILRKEVVVRAAIADVWHAWTTREGIASFFIPESNIDLRIGGPFELFMAMDKPDESGLRGSETCRILSYLDNEMLSFEWNFPPAVMNLRKSGAKTHVVIRFREIGEGQVKVTLSQLGWGKGEAWDAGYAYFDKAWGMVLNMLKDHFDKREAAAAPKARPPAELKEKTWVDKHVTVTSIEGESKRQDFELVIPAPVEAVWNVLTTREGLEKIGGRNSTVELMPGGKWEFWPGSPTRVQSYLPMEMLVVTGSAPPQFPEVQKGGHWGVYFFDPVDANKTRLRLNVVGWKEGGEWRSAFEYFLKNNPIFLEWIYSEFAFPVETTDGPNGQSMSAVVNAPRSAVWKAFTTKEGLESWMVASAEFDLRIGGEMRTHYSQEGVLGDANTIVNEVICYEPERMLSIRIKKPPEKFPFKSAWKNMWTVIYFDDAPDGKTRVRIVGLGHHEDEESKQMRAFFKRGNAATLRTLQEKFAPTDESASQAVRSSSNPINQEN
ncbi:MAG TPA: SRPBCC domain-containing protein [Phycisphaerae bacterium]|nr:SRPBCC domain-containing protein [Phycisphaerae bacterium]